jgi:vanillate O-demethylase monooxygenase subunit
MLVYNEYHEATMHWLKNTWYQAGWVNEIPKEGLLARTFLNTPLVFFRDEEGKISALLDRCPHRFAPLSAGLITNGVVTCGYHGLAFNSTGTCTHNPHGKITPVMKVDAYRVEERHTAFWVWMGDQEKADPALIPDLSFIDETPEVARIYGYMPTKANYQLITDNILDLSHADYLHPATLGGMMTQSETECIEEGDSLFVSWTSIDRPASGAFLHDVPPPNNGDYWIDVLWQPPAVMSLRVLACIHGQKPDEINRSKTLHNMIPETENSTHYFFCSTRKRFADSAEFTEAIRVPIMQAFLDEDKPMLEKQQLRIGNNDFWDMQPRLLSIDKAAVMARRKLDAMIEAEGES